jgi:hypothetical protein
MGRLITINTFDDSILIEYQKMFLIESITVKNRDPTKE